MKEGKVRRSRSKEGDCRWASSAAEESPSEFDGGPARTSQSNLELKRWLLVYSCVGSNFTLCGRPVACAYLEAPGPPTPPSVAPRAGGLIGLLGYPCCVDWPGPPSLHIADELSSRLALSSSCGPALVLPSTDTSNVAQICYSTVLDPYGYPDETGSRQSARKLSSPQLIISSISMRVQLCPA